MKKQIAKILRNVADKIYSAPKIASLLPPSEPIRVVRYEAKRLGVGYKYTQDEVVKFWVSMGKDPYRTEYETMEFAYIADIKDRINKGIFMEIEKNELIEYHIDEHSVSGFIYLNVTKDNETKNN